VSFKVAIVGRPNVGKSTLFNRLVGKKLALVDDTPGVTRDRREGEAHLGDLTFTVIDTAGLEEAASDSLEGRMRRQTDAAVADADVCLLLMDARAGVTPLDKRFAQILRKSPTPVVLVANKCEGGAGEAGRMEAFELGLGAPIPLSAEHGEGSRHSISRSSPMRTGSRRKSASRRSKTRSRPKRTPKGASIRMRPTSPTSKRRCASPSSGGPMSASRRW